VGTTEGDDDERFRDFVVARWAALVRTAYLLTGDHGRAEDVVQTVLEKVHRHWDRIERRDAPEVYARRAIVNQVTSWGRRRRVREVALPATLDRPGPDAYAEHDARDAVWQALATLPPRMRAVLVLRYFEDLSETDVALTLDCSVGTVKSQASRGLTRLREQLAEHDTTPATHAAAATGRHA
jgi:RNA polymerase sigma-70 factor (sigma-E family)